MRSDEISRLRSLVEDRLLPEVFRHPVWLNFLESGRWLSPNQIEHFQKIQRQFEADGDLHSACQLLFICAAQQHVRGDSSSAMACLEQILNFAKRQRSHQVEVWTIWAKSAIYVQRRDYFSAAYHLGDLERKLSSDEDWVLRIAIGQIGELLLEAARTSEQESRYQPLPHRFDHPVLQWLESWGRTPQWLMAQKSECSSTTTSLEPHNLEPKRAASSRILLVTIRLLAFLRRVFKSWRHVEPGRLTGKSGGFLPVRPPTFESLEPEARKPKTATSTGLLRLQFQTEPADGHSIAGYLLGSFRAFQDEALIRSWPGRKSKSIFKYLLIHHRRPVHREILMDLLWQATDPESARKNLHQAIYSLRQTLGREVESFPHILLEDECYRLNPMLEIWLDSENFTEYCDRGKRLDRQNHLPQAISEYEKAETLYQGDFLSEDPYEDWCIAHREHLKLAYLHLLERLSVLYFHRKQFAQAVQYCRKLVHEDPCREDAHCRLMRCMYFQGQRHLALSQFQICADALEQELGVTPMASTIRLHDEIKAGLLQIPEY